MGTTAAIWSWPEGLATGFAVAARDSARAAADELRHTELAGTAAQVKVLLEEAAALVAASLPPAFSLDQVEFYLRDAASLPELMPVTPEEIKLLSGSDPLSSAYARADLAESTASRARRARYITAREEAFAEYREDELQAPDMSDIKLLMEAKVEIGRALDAGLEAQIVSLTSRFHTEPQQRGILRLVAA